MTYRTHRAGLDGADHRAVALRVLAGGHFYFTDHLRQATQIVRASLLSS